ncbi:MAG: ABC transporter ATP-binding protein [Planctomycetota bacterium]|jgi:iron complex transport system ATP-binding protein
MPAISANKISFAYSGAEPVLQEASVEVAPGDFIGIVGPNGAGKSTLLRLLAGLLVPASGEVVFDGKNISSMPRIETARVIGYLPQAVVSSFSFRVLEIVLMGRYPHLGAFGFESDADRGIAEKALEATGTAQFAARPFSELSGGERQRVLIASVIAQEPEIFLLDEPTAALDLKHQVTIYELLSKQAVGGTGVVVVTHDLNLAAQFCRRLVLLVDGKVAAVGAPGEVVTPEKIREIYGDNIIVGKNPETGMPTVLPVRKKNGSAEDAGGQS